MTFRLETAKGVLLEKDGEYLEVLMYVDGFSVKLETRVLKEDEFLDRIIQVEKEKEVSQDNGF